MKCIVQYNIDPNLKSRAFKRAGSTDFKGLIAPTDASWESKFEQINCNAQYNLLTHVKKLYCTKQK